MHPEEEAALGVRPGCRSLGKILPERTAHRCRLGRIVGADLRQVGVQEAAAAVLGDQHLRHHRRAEVHALLGDDHLADQLGVADRPGHAGARREDLGEGGRKEHALPGHREERGQGLAPVPQLAVGVVLEDRDAVAGGDLGEAVTSLGAQARPRGIGEVDDGVDELGDPCRSRASRRR